MYLTVKVNLRLYSTRMYIVWSYNSINIHTFYQKKTTMHGESAKNVSVVVKQRKELEWNIVEKY